VIVEGADWGCVTLSLPQARQRGAKLIKRELRTNLSKLLFPEIIDSSKSFYIIGDYLNVFYYLLMVLYFLDCDMDTGKYILKTTDKRQPPGLGL